MYSHISMKLVPQNGMGDTCYWLLLYLLEKIEIFRNKYTFYDHYLLI